MTSEATRIAQYGVISLVSAGVLFMFANDYVDALQTSQNLSDESHLGEYLDAHPIDAGNIFVLRAMGGLSAIIGFSLCTYAAYAALRRTD